MPFINEGFTGWSTVYGCSFINLFNPWPIEFPGSGSYSPFAYPCLEEDGSVHTPLIYPVPGIFGGGGAPTVGDVWTSPFGIGSTGGISLVVDTQTPSNPIHNTLLGNFGLMDVSGIYGEADNYLNYSNGVMETGLCCLLNGVGRSGDGTKGYGIRMSNGDLTLGGFSIALVEYQNGLNQYRILAGKSGAWSEGEYVSLSLEWVIDDANLKGVYLKAGGGTFLTELVYTSSDAHRPTSQGFAGKYGIAKSRVIIFH